MKLLLKRITKESGENSDMVLALDEIVYEFPEAGHIKGALKVGNGRTKYKDLDYLIPQGSGPTTPDAILGVAQMLADCLKIKEELNELLRSNR